MIKTVHLHGSLAELHDGPIRVAANTAAEAVEAVTRQLQGFQPGLKRPLRRLKVVGCETVEDLYAPLATDAVHLIPQLNGGKKGGFIQILIGIALVAASFLIPGIGQTLAGILLKTGALLILGGVSQMLAPKPNSDDDQQRSEYLGAPGNTVRIGTRIPIAYGRNKIYGHYLSFDINARQVTAKA